VGATILDFTAATPLIPPVRENSHWPARSGVLIEDDKLFFTAGMWSRDGVFIYCLDPRDGSVVWRNDTSGYHFATLPHSTGYAGVAPQGYRWNHDD
jgi:outer membrane protein assembly factor BamB